VCGIVYIYKHRVRNLPKVLPMVKRDMVDLNIQEGGLVVLPIKLPLLMILILDQNLTRTTSKIGFLCPLSKTPC